MCFTFTADVWIILYNFLIKITTHHHDFVYFIIICTRADYPKMLNNPLIPAVNMTIMPNAYFLLPDMPSTLKQ